ncbi:uncharacterized protein LOC100375084 [Saccoglossus kowalevskii]
MNFISFDSRKLFSQKVSTLSSGNKSPQRLRYLLPIYVRGGGPNWQYNNFKAAVRLSLYYNRTVVAVPFLGHRSHHGDFRDFQQTFDIDYLRELLPVATLQEFQRDCRGRVDAILTPSTIFPTFIAMYETHYNGSRDTFRKTWGIELPEFASIPETDEERREVFDKTRDVECLGIFHPINVFGLEVPDGLEYEPWADIPMDSTISRATYSHVRRAPLIRKLADIALDGICENEPFMAIHWRNKTGERCMNPSGIEKVCRRILPMFLNATKNIVVKGIATIAHRKQIKCIYIARPSYTNKIDAWIAEEIDRVFTADDILLMKDPRLSVLKDDNYVLSLVEQEICARSNLFGSTWLSSWSKFVAEERKTGVFYFYPFPGLTEEISLLV